jgi:hypothetical protein
MTDNILTSDRRKVFEQRGLDLIKQDLGSSGIVYLASSQDKQAAEVWIKEQEEKQSQLEQTRYTENLAIARQGATFAKRACWIAVASLTIAIASLIVAIVALLK